VFRERATTSPTAGRRATATVPGRAPQAVRVRGRRCGSRVHAGHGLPAGQGVRQDVHVHHHAGYGAREVQPVTRGRRQSSNHRCWP